jgi:uncharacterized coiled-coil DUF342 family protein
MTDSEMALVRRWKIENDELSRRHRGLAARLQRVDVELDRSVVPDRVAELRAERERITQLVDEVERRMRTSWDQASGAGDHPPDLPR